MELSMATLEQSCFYKNFSSVIFFILNFWYPLLYPRGFLFHLVNGGKKDFDERIPAFMTHFQESTYSVLYEQPIVLRVIKKASLQHC